jgi:hypothetical protein
MRIPDMGRKQRETLARPQNFHFSTAAQASKRSDKSSRKKNRAKFEG